jgi:uncharacterized membrane protein YwaF
MDKLFKVFPLFYYDIAAIIVFFTIYFLLRNSSEKVKRHSLYIMCLINFVFYLINDYYFYIRGDSILTLLPLQLCNIAVFLVPLAIALKKQVIYDFVFYICATGAIVALMIPSSDYVGITYSLMTISFFVFHYMIAAVPFLLVGLGIYKPAPSISKALRLSIAIFLLGGLMHILNLVLGATFNVKANYFFTIIEYSAPSNPAFEFLSRIIPYDFFYLLPALLVLYVYMIIIFLITNLKLKYMHKHTKTGTSNTFSNP